MSGGDALVRLVHAIDRLDWDGIRACLADTVQVDYSELFDTPAAPTPAEDLIDQWQALLPGFTSTQHLLGPILVETGPSSGPAAHAHVRAWHHLPDAEPWVVAGHYEALLDAEGRIAGLTLRVFHVDGPHDATERASARAGAHPRTER